MENKKTSDVILEELTRHESERVRKAAAKLKFVYSTAQEVANAINELSAAAKNVTTDMEGFIEDGVAEIIKAKLIERWRQYPGWREGVLPGGIISPHVGGPIVEQGEFVVGRVEGATADLEDKVEKAIWGIELRNMSQAAILMPFYPTAQHVVNVINELSKIGLVWEGLDTLVRMNLAQRKNEQQTILNKLKSVGAAAVEATEQIEKFSNTYRSLNIKKRKRKIIQRTKK